MRRFKLNISTKTVTDDAVSLPEAQRMRTEPRTKAKLRQRGTVGDDGTRHPAPANREHSLRSLAIRWAFNRPVLCMGLGGPLRTYAHLGYLKPGPGIAKTDLG